MAQIRLRRSETVAERLPEVCMACGQPATTHIRKSFAWQPPWVIITIFFGLLIYVILALILTKRMTVEVPVCDRHRGYWLKRGLWIFLSFVGFIGFCFAAGFALDAILVRDTIGIICLTCVAALVVWLVSAVVIQSLMIKPKEITDRSITLTKVHPDFVAAFVGMNNDDFDEDFRPRRHEVDGLPPERQESFRETRDPDDLRVRKLDD
jgi:hypothetical protein